MVEAVAVLTRTPATLNALLRGLPSIGVRGIEGKDTWSAFDIMGNLVFQGPEVHKAETKE